nr:unnamed protein product [Spirometra erinaceieuropaei]
MIFAVHQLQEKCQEMRTHLYSAFVDPTKAFDAMNREGLWKIMQEFGCPDRFMQMVRPLHDDDCALNATSEGDMQMSMKLFAASCNNFGLVINTDKTVVMHLLPPDAAYVAPKINTNDVQLQFVDNFTYLGSTFSRQPDPQS